MAREPKPPPKLPKRSPWERLVDRVTGARLCFGDPVQTGATTVIPVARIRVTGGFGFGRGGTNEEGGGGGGHLDAMPLGFIEVRPGGASYTQIPDPERSQRLIRAGAAAAATLLTGIAGARRLGQGRSRGSRKLLHR
jgi:uncharacterized spore protein YtfJ